MFSLPKGLTSILLALLITSISQNIAILNSVFPEYTPTCRNYIFYSETGLTSEEKLLLISQYLRARDVKVKIHKVKTGENFWGIARQYRIDINTIVGANPELRSLTASVNQEIYILNKKGVLHLVREGDTLRSLSMLYRVYQESILHENYIFNQSLTPGTILFIPRAHPVEMAPEIAEYYQTRGIFYSSIVGGRITSTFGYRIDPLGGGRGFHNGIDIAAPPGTPIYASANGRVIFADSLGGYGKTIRIVHKDGYSTFYAHCSVILVKTGQQVRRGQIIARVGKTGKVTGSHLHFSIFRYGRPLNPFKFL